MAQGPRKRVTSGVIMSHTSQRACYVHGTADNNPLMDVIVTPILQTKETDLRSLPKTPELRRGKVGIRTLNHTQEGLRQIRIWELISEKGVGGGS